MLFKTSSIFFFTSQTSAKRFPFFWPFIRVNRKKNRMAQGQVNREDEELISLTENKTSRTLFVLYYQPSQKSPNFLTGT